MGFNIGKIASVVSGISTASSVINIAQNLNLGSINASNIGSMKNSLQSALNGDMSSITGKLETAIMPNDIESMATQFDIDGQTKKLQQQLSTQSGTMDTAQMDAMMSDIESNMDNTMNNINSSFSGINFM